MYKVGHVDLGTSHPPSFVNDLKELGYLPYGVFDDFRLTGRKYLDGFSQKYSLKIYSSLEEMADDVDVVFIHSVNWDIHLDRLMPFAQKGKGIFIDKPMFGNLKDITKIIDLYKSGVRITGGSMVIYADEMESLKKDTDFVDNIHLVFAGSPNDMYYYGVHAVYMVSGVLGYEIESARFVTEKGQKVYELTWKSGKKAMVALGDIGCHFPFHMTLISQKGVRQFSIKGGFARKNMFSKIMPYLAGECADIVPLDKLINCEIACFACRESELKGGAVVKLNDLRDKSYFDGKAYEAIYKSSLKPKI